MVTGLRSNWRFFHQKKNPLFFNKLLFIYGDIGFTTVCHKCLTVSATGMCTSLAHHLQNARHRRLAEFFTELFCLQLIMRPAASDGSQAGDTQLMLWRSRPRKRPWPSGAPLSFWLPLSHLQLCSAPASMPATSGKLSS